MEASSFQAEAPQVTATVAVSACSAAWPTPEQEGLWYFTAAEQLAPLPPGLLSLPPQAGTATAGLYQS